VVVDADDDRDRTNTRVGVTVDVFDLEWNAPGSAGLLRLEIDLVHGVSRVGIVLDVVGAASVAMVAVDLPVPVGNLELRGPAVWLELRCETPLDHWTVGLEAFGVTVDDGQLITAETRGALTPMGLDLDLDTVAPGPRGHDQGLEVPVRVHGEVLIGAAGMEIDGTGVRWRGGGDVPPDPARPELRDRLRLGSGRA
jgi:hypothetical protein